jgi:hypothetical protein
MPDPVLPETIEHNGKVFSRLLTRGTGYVVVGNTKYFSAMSRPRDYSDDYKRFDIDFGRKSGIPECCIAYFVGPYQLLTDDERFDRQSCPQLYVPCDDCLKSGHTVPLIRCGPDWRPESFTGCG